MTSQKILMTKTKHCYIIFVSMLKFQIIWMINRAKALWNVVVGCLTLNVECWNLEMWVVPVFLLPLHARTTRRQRKVVPNGAQRGHTSSSSSRFHKFIKMKFTAISTTLALLLLASSVQAVSLYWTRILLQLHSTGIHSLFSWFHFHRGTRRMLSSRMTPTTALSGAPPTTSKLEL